MCRGRFIDLARTLGELGAWVRMHYVYPYPHVDQVIPLMAAGKVLPYLDIPFQHGSPTVLKRMRRPAHSVDTLKRIARWRSECPGLVLRSTFIVGFPGETEQEFAELLDWLRSAKPDVVWVGLSTPKQECFMAEYVDRLRVPLLVGVGAAFDFHTGRIEDAPAWVKRAGLQWLHRLLQDPGRH